MSGGYTRRYLFRLYPDSAQASVLHDHRRMIAELWNALLERHEEIRRRTVQRQTWRDRDGGRHTGEIVHRLTWETERKRNGERFTVQPGENWRPKRYTKIDMQNEVTWLYNSCREWREISVWCGHRTAQLLDRAFDAFHRRMRELRNPAVYAARSQRFVDRHGRLPTRMELAGYPRFKRTAEHDSIPHRFASGCRMVRYQPPRLVAPERNPAASTTGFAALIDHAQELYEAAQSQSRRAQKSGGGRRWLLTLKGVPGDIQARGYFPGEPTKWLDADVMWRDGAWWISVCVEIERERSAGSDLVTIKFDLLDEMAQVNGQPETPAEIVEVSLLQDRRDEMQAEHDERYPRGRRPADEAERGERARGRAALSRLSARIARKRRNALHVWTTRVIGRASDITIFAPPVRELTRTPRGGARRWGANVATVSALNRNTLAQAPSMAIQMLRYKAAEAGIRCDVIEDDAPGITVGRDLVATGKTLRRASRTTRKEAA